MHLSFTDHAVSQPISMGTGRRVGVGTGYHHQASEVGTVLSPRSRFVCFYIVILFPSVTRLHRVDSVYQNKTRDFCPDVEALITVTCKKLKRKSFYELNFKRITYINIIFNINYT